MNSRTGLRVALIVLVSLGGAASSADAGEERAEPTTQAQADSIRSDLQARARFLPEPALLITESTTTDAIDSFTLLSRDLLERRFIPAAGGVWYAICPVSAVCPFPRRRMARSAQELVPRRLALELVIRTFLETDAAVVGVALPTPRIVAVVLDRTELAEVDLPALARTLATAPLLDASVGVRRLVDELTLPRTYLFLGFEPGPNGGVSWAGMPRWPVARQLGLDEDR